MTACVRIFHGAPCDKVEDSVVHDHDPATCQPDCARDSWICHPFDDGTDDTAHPELPMARVKLLDALCFDCKAPITIWRTAVGRLMADRRRSLDEPPMERHDCSQRGWLVDL